MFFFSWYIQNAYHPRMEFYEPDTSSGIHCIVYTTQLTLQQICLIKSASKRRRVEENWRFSSFLFPWSLALRHQSLACYSRLALASAWKTKRLRRRQSRTKSISFDDVTTKQGPIVRIACSRRSDSGARGKNLTRSPSSERLERAIRRIARAVLAGKNRQILELYKL